MVVLWQGYHLLGGLWELSSAMVESSSSSLIVFCSAVCLLNLWNIISSALFRRSWCWGLSLDQLLMRMAGVECRDSIHARGWGEYTAHALNLTFVLQRASRESSVCRKTFCLFLMICNPLKKREWAAPGSTAIPGQPVGRAKQASFLVPSRKNWINSLGAMPPLELLNSKEQLFLLDLSQKAEKR